MDGLLGTKQRKGTGDEETDAIAREAKQLQTRAKEWIGQWQELLKRVRKWSVNVRTTSVPPDAAAQQLRALAARGGTGPLAQLALLAASTQEQIEATRVQMADDAMALFVEPLELFVAKVMTPALQESLKMKKAKAVIASCLGRTKSAMERHPLDMAAVAAAQRETWEARHRYRRAAKTSLFMLRHAVQLSDPTTAGCVAKWLLAHLQSAQNLRALEDKGQPAMREVASIGRQWAEQWAHERNDRDKMLKKRDALSQQETLSRLVSELANPNLLVASAVSTAVSGVDLPTLLVCVLDAFRFSLPVIAAGIQGEVSGTQKASTLFRGNSMSTKLMAAYTRQTGLPYLRATLGPHVTRLLSLPPNAMEVDPKMFAEAGEREQEALGAATQALLDEVYTTVDAIPIPLRWMARTLRDAVAKRFPDTARAAVGGFLFLRFVCPALLSPEHHGLADGNLKMDQRRPLTLVTKIIQNLSNEVQFGAKEAFMVPFNSLLDRNTAAMATFLDAVVDIAETDIGRVSTLFEPLATVEQCRRTLMPQLIDMTVSNLDKVAQKMREHGQAAEIVPLADLLAEIVAFGGNKGDGGQSPVAVVSVDEDEAAAMAAAAASPRPAHALPPKLRQRADAAAVTRVSGAPPK